MEEREILALVGGSGLFVFCFLKLEPWQEPVSFYYQCELEICKM